VISFINDCLVEDLRSSSVFPALAVVVNKLHLSRLNKIRNAVAHNIYVVEGDREANSRICYSETDSRSYFQKTEYKTMQSADLLKLLDMLSIFHDLFLGALQEVVQRTPDVSIVLCQGCGQKSFGNAGQLQNKKCYFCHEVGNFKTGSVTTGTLFPPLP